MIFGEKPMAPTLNRHRQQVGNELAALIWERCGDRLSDVHCTALRLALAQIVQAESIIGAGKILRAFPGLARDWLEVLKRSAKAGESRAKGEKWRSSETCPRRNTPPPRGYDIRP